MRVYARTALFAAAAAAATLLTAGCGGGGSRYDFLVTAVANYANPATPPIPGGMAVIDVNGNGSDFPTAAGAYTAYFASTVNGPYDADTGEGGAPTIATNFTDNGDGTFRLTVTIPVQACEGPVYLVAEDYAAPPVVVPVQQAC